jgi:hypothetical protein
VFHESRAMDKSHSRDQLVVGAVQQESHTSRVERLVGGKELLVLLAKHQTQLCSLQLTVVLSRSALIDAMYLRISFLVTE